MFSIKKCHLHRQKSMLIVLEIIFKFNSLIINDIDNMFIRLCYKKLYSNIIFNQMENIFISLPVKTYFSNLTYSINSNESKNSLNFF